MGCKESRKLNKISFDDEVIQKLQTLFDRLRQRYTQTSQTDYLCQEAFEYLSEGRIELGRKLYQFMLKESTTQKVDFENLIPIIEILIGESTSYHLTKYRSLDKMEIFFLISIQRLTVSEQELPNSKVSYLEALKFLQDVEFICQKSGLVINSKFSLKNPDDAVARSILSAIYPSESGSVEWWSLILFFKQLLPHISEQVKIYYRLLFLTTRVQKIQSRFQKPSYLLNSQQFIYLALGNSYIKSSSQINLLWSNAIYGWNFESVFKQLMTIDTPTIFLMKFADTQQNESIIGAFHRKKWIDVETYQGNEESYLFQLTPSFKIFSSQRFKRQFANDSDVDTQNYAKLLFQDKNRSIKAELIGGTDKIHEYGLGFGGRQDQYRLWIDCADMQNASYVTSEDDTYKKGSLVNPILKTPRLVYMEIWSIGKEVDVLSTQLLIEKAKQQYLNFSYLESHYLKQQMRVHKEMIDLMKDKLDIDTVEQQPVQKEQFIPVTQSRKSQMLDLAGDSGPTYEHNVRVTATSLAKNRATKSYIQTVQIEEDNEDVDLGFGNTQLIRGSVPEIIEEPEYGFRRTQLIRSSYQD